MNTVITLLKASASKLQHALASKRLSSKSFRAPSGTMLLSHMRSVVANKERVPSGAAACGCPISNRVGRLAPHYEALPRRYPARAFRLKLGRLRLCLQAAALCIGSCRVAVVYLGRGQPSYGMLPGAGRSVCDRKAPVVQW